MNTDRIREIQKRTAYPDSLSVYTALLQVWNETVQDIQAVKRLMEHKEKCAGKSRTIFPKGEEEV